MTARHGIRSRLGLHGRPKNARVAAVTALFAIVVFADLALIHTAQSDETSPSGTLLFDPETGYRVGRYRTPTPDTVPGGKRVLTDAVQQMVDDGTAVLIDVLSAEGVGPDPIDGEWLVSKPHDNIPGSVWLPEVGQGTLDEVMMRYFQDQLTALTDGVTDRAIVFYCVADCWMSWNAARRAAKWGYTNVHWYAEGTDGWVENGLSLVPAVPIPVPMDE